MPALMSRDEAAERLASFHYAIEPYVREVFRLRGPAGNDPDEPIGLLEVNEATIPSGIMPIGFGPAPEREMPYASVIIEVTPEEFDAVRSGRLSLPDGWSLGEAIPRPAANGTP